MKNLHNRLTFYTSQKNKKKNRKKSKKHRKNLSKLPSLNKSQEKVICSFVVSNSSKERFFVYVDKFDLKAFSSILLTA